MLQAAAAAPAAAAHCTTGSRRTAHSGARRIIIIGAQCSHIKLRSPHCMVAALPLNKRKMQTGNGIPEKAKMYFDVIGLS